jgi:hypothetical protein
MLSLQTLLRRLSYIFHYCLSPYKTMNRLYPFSDTVTTTITAKAAFTYYVRIPSWVVGGTIAINNAAAKSVAPVNGLQAVTVAAGTTTFVLQLPAPITTGKLSMDNLLPSAQGSPQKHAHTEPLPCTEDLCTTPSTVIMIFFFVPLTSS